MDPRWTRIIPDLNDGADDRERYRDEHNMLFGHYPPDNPDEKCQHPIHAAIRREVNGATFDISFDPSSIITEDSEYERARRSRYDDVFAATRQFQKSVEEEDKYRALKAAGFIVPFGVGWNKN